MEKYVVIMSSVAVVISVLAPIVTAVITSKYQMWQKKFEVLQSGVMDSVAELTKSFSGLDSGSIYATHHLDFMASAYRVMSQIDNRKIYRDLLDLIEKLQANQFETTPEIKAQFSSIMLEIAHYIDTK